MVRIGPNTYDIHKIIILYFVFEMVNCYIHLLGIKTDRQVFQNNKKKIRFNGVDYVSFEALSATYNRKLEKDSNYQSAYEGHTEPIIEELLRTGAISKRPESDRVHLTLNPIGVLDKQKPGKNGELLLHWVGNSMYAEPTFKLETVPSRSEIH